MGLSITIDNFFCIFFLKNHKLTLISITFVLFYFFISSNCTDNHFILACICVILHPLFCLCKLKLLVASSHANSSLLVFLSLNSESYNLTKTICNAKCYQSCKTSYLIQKPAVIMLRKKVELTSKESVQA